MKLATLKDGSRDGSLAVVSRDLSKAVVAETAVPGLKTLQQLMDNWESTQPKVAQICADLNKSANGGLAAPLSVDFEGYACTAPLRRAIYGRNT